MLVRSLSFLETTTNQESILFRRLWTEFSQDRVTLSSKCTFSLCDRFNLCMRERDVLIFERWLMKYLVFNLRNLFVYLLSMKEKMQGLFQIVCSLWYVHYVH